MIKIIFAIFILLLILREVAAWYTKLPVKYFLTPLIIMSVVMLPVLSIMKSGMTQYNMFILISLLLAIAADTLLMIEEVNLMKSGMFFFLAGHICYAVAFSVNTSFRPWNLLVIAVLAAISIYLIKKIRIQAGKLFPVIILYIISIDVMFYLAVTGLNFGLTQSAISVAAGAVLFAISDYIISSNSFVKKIPHSTVYPWAFYAPGQFLIALSTL